MEERGRERREKRRRGAHLSLPSICPFIPGGGFFSPPPSFLFWCYKEEPRRRRGRAPQPSTHKAEAGGARWVLTLAFQTLGEGVARRHARANGPITKTQCGGGVLLPSIKRASAADDGSNLLRSRSS